MNARAEKKPIQISGFGTNSGSWGERSFWICVLENAAGAAS